MFHHSHKIGRATLAALLVAALFFTSVYAQGFTIYPDQNVMTLREGEEFNETLTVTVPAQAAVSKADIYFLADTTGSMGGAIDAVKVGANDLLSALIAALPDTDLQFGVGNYKDFPYDLYAFQHQVSLTADTVAVQVGISDWYASGGVDGSEGQFFALDRLADNVNPTGGSIGWRPDTKKIIVWFGDMPAHDPVCSAISGLPDAITEASLTTKLVDNMVSVIAISVYGSAGLDLNPTPYSSDYSGYCVIDGSAGQAGRIAAVTGGVDVFNVDPASLVDTIADLIEAQVKIITNLSLVPTVDTAQFVSGLEPSGGYGPIDTSTETTLNFDITFTGIPCGEDEVTYYGTIDVVADGSVEAAKSVEITVPRCLITVGIDIKPGSYPNSINLKPRGVIPVAILGSADFDVHNVDMNSLIFAGLPVKIKGDGLPQCVYQDVSGNFTNPIGAPDGFIDLVCQYIMDLSKWAPGDGYATLTGMLLDGTPIEGTDTIRIIK
jgi:hypothetical protein